jgi:hypothetical protein
MITDFRGLVVVTTLAAAIAGGRTPLSAQPNSAQRNPCALVTADEVQVLVPKEHVEAGVPTSFAAFDSFSCRYTWGLGVHRSTVVIAVNSATRTFVGLNTDSIKRELVAQVVPHTADAAIPDLGDAAAFKAYSAAYASATAYARDQIVQVAFSGVDAPDVKPQLISLLKSAVSRL